jgi:hypothetical protein
MVARLGRACNKAQDATEPGPIEQIAARPTRVYARTRTPQFDRLQPSEVDAQPARLTAQPSDVRSRRTPQTACCGSERRKTPALYGVAGCS